MNSFLKGFFSLFDWMFPKTLDESLDDLDNSMKDLYDRMGWGKYNNPLCHDTDEITGATILGIKKLIKESNK